MCPVFLDHLNVLKVAQDEINEKADFQFDYTLRKEGRKITAIDFKFRKSIPVQQPITVPIQATKQVQGQTDARLPRTIERMKSYGLNEHQINIVLKKYTVAELCKILYELDCNKETIKNTVAYLCKILEL